MTMQCPSDARHINKVGVAPARDRWRPVSCCRPARGRARGPPPAIRTSEAPAVGVVRICDLPARVALPNILVVEQRVLLALVKIGSLCKNREPVAPRGRLTNPHRQTMAAACCGSVAGPPSDFCGTHLRGQAPALQRGVLQGQCTHPRVRLAQRAAKPARRPGRQLRQALHPERAAQAGRTPGVLEPAAARADGQHARAAGHR